MKKFEYKVLTMDIRQGWSLTAVKLDGNSLMEKLEEYGSDGWELVNTVDTNLHEGGSNELVLIFKREKE